ncbi:MAG: Gfo/Idh/MocA family oxidoreductase [Anaerolineae bacterium]|nr:MAG: Gfo/Idh/MocA family oxidoreductase [Anaerolineae bacterium]
MLKVAVIGVGSMGRNHVRVYSEMPGVELVGVADANPAAAEAIGAKYGVPAFADYNDLLAKAQPDAVTIAVPTALHEEVAGAALEAGAHVLVEKPIAATLEQGRRLIALAEQHNRKLMVGHIVRFNPALQMLKQKLNDGELGRTFQIVCRRAGPFPARIRDVGVVVDLAPHDLDVMRFLTDSEPVRIFAEVERRVHTEHEDLMLGLVRFANGVIGHLEINWLTPTKMREVLVLGERGMFRVDDLTQDLYFFENAETEGDLWGALQAIKGVSEGRMVRFAVPRQEPLKLELQAFVDAVASDRPVPVGGVDGLQALKLALMLVESGRKNQAQVV